MTREQLVWYAGSVLLAALGMWLMLPHARMSGRWVRISGAVLALAALVGFCWDLPRLTPLVGEGVFWALALVTIVSAAATVTFRSPVYCAIWFAMTLLGTSGLFFFQGAQFLAVATLVVYAGAILVTFLFVLMLAQPEGHAYYDRVSWEAPLSTIAGAVLVGILTMSISHTFNSAPAETAAQSTPSPGTPGEGRGEGLAATNPSTAATVKPVTLPTAEFHMAQLGGELFGRHLIAVEVAGTLLLAALVGAAAIVAQGKPATARGGRGDG